MGIHGQASQAVVSPEWWFRYQIIACCCFPAVVDVYSTDRGVPKTSDLLTEVTDRGPEIQAPDSIHDLLYVYRLMILPSSNRA